MISGAGILQTLAMYAWVKEAKYFPSMFDMIMVHASAQVKIQLITSIKVKV